MRLRITAAASLLAAALAAGGACAAQADSIAYVKDGDVWLSTSDGGRQYRVTTSGGYASVSQDRYGDMIALRGTRLHWLGRDGTLRTDIYTPVSTGPGAQNGSDGRQWFGPFDPKLSPDGRKVAYHWYYRSIDGGCLPEFQTVCVYLRQGTAYSRPDRLTSLDDEQFKSQSGWIYPTWLDDDAVAISDPSPSFGNPDVMLHTPYPFSGTDGLSRWFSDETVELHDGEFDPTKRKAAYVGGDNHELLRFYRTPQGHHPYVPNPCYEIRDPVGGRFDGPSWSPDGTRIAFAQGDGVYVAAVPDFTNDCGDPTDAGRLLLPGAKSADWGPADVPAGSGRVPGGGGGGGGGGGEGGGGGGVPTPIRTGAALASRPVNAKALAGRGVAVKVSCATACRTTAALRLGGRTLGSAAMRLPAAGTRTLRVKVSPRQRRALLSARRPRVQVRVTLAPTGGKPVVTTLVLRLR